VSTYRLRGWQRRLRTAFVNVNQIAGEMMGDGYSIAPDALAQAARSLRIAADTMEAAIAVNRSPRGRKAHASTPDMIRDASSPGNEKDVSAPAIPATHRGDA